MATASFPTTQELSTKSALVSCEWLRQNLDRPNQVILDATYFLPRQHRNAQEEFKLQHIPRAQLFNIDEIADQQPTNPYAAWRRSICSVSGSNGYRQRYLGIDL